MFVFIYIKNILLITISRISEISIFMINETNDICQTKYFYETEAEC